MRTKAIVPGSLALFAGALFIPGCTSGAASVDPTCTVDCGAGDGPGEGAEPIGGSTCEAVDGGAEAPPRSDDGIQNGKETDIDCGGPNAPRCTTGKKCLVDADCTVACGYESTCIEIRSCKRHLGGDTCGLGEVGQAGAKHESCCRTLPVNGYEDPAHPGKKVYLDKYEVTVGRVRAFLETIRADHNGIPDVRDFVVKDPPPIWDSSWNTYVPADDDGETIMAPRKLLGDPRGTWPGAPPVPPADEPRKTGVDFQFNGSLFMYLHGNNCSTHTPDAYGFPTWFYPANVLAKMGPEFPPRADGKDHAGNLVPAREHLEVKAMNCITNALLAAFCHWDGGQLATDDVLDYVTGSPSWLGNDPGCGTQIGTEDPPTSGASMSGGRCADLRKINATYDAGGALPEPNFPLNENLYMFPYFDEPYDKAWEIAAPGRGTTKAGGEALDQVRIHEGDEPWMDLAGNVNEVVLVMNDGKFSGKFGLKYRGIGYQSARSLLNADPKWDSDGVARLERPQAKAAFAGGRCMRFE